MVGHRLQRIAGAFAEFDAVLADRGERRIEFFRNRKIVETDHADVFRHGIAERMAAVDDAFGDEVVAAENRGRAAGQETGHMMPCGVRDEVAVDGKLRIDAESVARHAVQVSGHPSVGDHRARGPVEKGDLLMPQGGKMGDGHIETFVGIRADIADHRIDRYGIIQKHSRDGRRAELFDPWIGQGETDKKRAGALILEHHAFITVFLLKLRRDRDDRNAPALAAGSLAEAEHDPVTERILRFIIHVLYEDGERSVLRLFCPAVFIAQLDGGLQDAVPERFADIHTAVQSFRNRADRDSQFFGNVPDRCHAIISFCV